MINETKCRNCTSTYNIYQNDIYQTKAIYSSEKNTNFLPSESANTDVLRFGSDIHDY